MNILNKISDLKKSISLKIERRPQFVDKYALEKCSSKTLLGSGSFAKVWSCRRADQPNSGDDIQLAVKIFDRKSQPGLRREFRNEAKLMRTISAHENCVQMFDAFEGSRFCHIIMEKCECSVQEAFLKSAHDDITESDLAHVFKCMLSGVQHLHQCGIVHRDIKPANVLLANTCSLLNRPSVKICDLGLATRFPARGGLKETCGTAPYMAPEMLLKKNPYDCKVDVWSCGVTAYLMLLGGFPYAIPKGADAADMKKAIREGIVRPSFKVQHSDFPEPSVAAIKFLQSLLKRDPDIRASCERALSCQFIKSAGGPTLTSSSFGPQPSFGATLSVAHEKTKAEPPAETPNPQGLSGNSDEDLSTDESTTCGSGEEDVASSSAQRRDSIHTTSSVASRSWQLGDDIGYAAMA